MKAPNKIPLLNFEAFAENDDLLIAEKLFEENKLVDLTKNQQGLWIGIVTDKGEEFGTSIGIYKEFVRATICSCSPSADLPLCPHVLVTLFGIRQKFTQKTGERITSNPQIKAHFKTSQIIEAASKDELKNFINVFARKDKKFKILLMTHFARYYFDLTEANIFRYILDECYPASDVLLAKNTRQNIHLLANVGNEFILQCKDAFSLSKYTEVFQILQELIVKIAYAMHSNPTSQDLLFAIQSTAHNMFVELINAEITPAMRQQLAETILEIAQLSYYNYTGNNNFFELISKLSFESQQLESFSKNLNNKINSLKNLETQALILSTKIKIQYALYDNFEPSFQKLKDPALLNEVILQMNKPENQTILEQFLQKLKEEKMITTTMQYKHLLSLHAKLNDTKNQIFYATELFKLTRELQYYRILKNIEGVKKGFSHKMLIQKKLNLQLDKDLRLALDLCHLEEDLALLIQLLTEKDSFEWFMEYDKYLVKGKPAEVYDFYEHYLMRYHKDHLGMKAVHRANTIIEHLEALGLAKESMKLRKKIITLYPKRQSLKENL